MFRVVGRGEVKDSTGKVNSLEFAYFSKATTGLMAHQELMSRMHEMKAVLVDHKIFVATDEEMKKGVPDIMDGNSAAYPPPRSVATVVDIPWYASPMNVNFLATNKDVVHDVTEF